MNATAVDRDQLAADFIDYLQKTGNRVTIPRKVILKAALDFENSFDAETLYLKAKSIDPIISLTSVYRTLPILVEAGILIETDLLEKKQRYQIGAWGTMQFVMECTQCGSIEEIDPGCTRLQLNAFLKTKGILTQSISVKVKGICSSCSTEAHRQDL